MKRISITAAVVMGSAALFSTSAFAGGFTPDNPGTKTIAVGLTIEDECTIDADPIAFGTHGVLETQIDTTADVRVECTKGTAYAIALDAGLNASGVVADRAMTDGTDKINYQLYSDGSFLSIWGNTFGSGATVVGAGSASGDLETHTIHARVPVQTSEPVGTYADTVTATIWYADHVGGS